MSDDQRLVGDFEVLSTGVPNFDTILGGGIPVGSFNLIAGGPGTGKTILAHQIMFANATPERVALHFTVLGEPVTKLLRYQSRFTFFDPAKVGTAIRYVDIGDVIRKEGLQRGLDLIISRVERYAPSIVVIDSVRAVREIARGSGESGFRAFTSDLSQVAVVWNATSFLLGEFEGPEMQVGPEFTLADGILWMEMPQVDNSVVRKLQMIKSRGMNLIQGLHSFRIDPAGIYIYPRLAPPITKPQHQGESRAGFGVASLDRMMLGGIPEAETCLIAGSSGTGKSVLAQHFIADGLRKGERCVVVTFEETPAEYTERAESLGFPFQQAIAEDKLTMIYYRPLDLTVDQVIDETRTAVERTGARRLVIDSITGFEVARAPADRSNFREALYRMVGWFRAQGLAVVMTAEVPEMFGEPRLTSYEISFITDNIIFLRFIEIESELRRVLAVVKMRRSGHERELRQFTITPGGIVIGSPFREYTGLLSGTPSLVTVVGPQPFAPGLEARESALVAALFGLGSATADDLSAETGFARTEVDRMLNELVGRGYVVRTSLNDRVIYHVSMVSWVPGIRRETRPRSGPIQGDASGE